MNITIDTSELDAVAQSLGFSDRRMRAVVASALTAAARDIERTWAGQLSGRIDRPNPATRQAAVLSRATASELVAEVKLRDRASKTGTGSSTPQEWLLPLERGGARALKRFELVLQRVGAMPAGMRAVPGSGAKLDQFGNVSRSQIIGVLNQLGGTSLTKGYRRVIGATAGKRAAAARRGGREYVAINTRLPGGLAMGIYERTASSRRARTISGTLRGLVPVFLFTSTTRYRKLLSLVDEGLRVASASLPGHAARYLDDHIKAVTAKHRGAGA